MERKIVYGLIVFSITGLNTNEDCILMYPENLSNVGQMRQCSKKFAELNRKRQKFENNDMNINCLIHHDILLVPKYSNSDKIVNLVREFLLYEFTEENIESFKRKGGGAALRRFSKLNEIDIEANGIKVNSPNTKKVSFNGIEKEKDLDDVNETLGETNLTDQLLLSSERHSEGGKSNLLDAEVSHFDKAKGIKQKTKDRLKAKNQGDCALSIEMKNIEFGQEGKSGFGSRVSESTRIENVDNIEEEIVIKELKGPVLFKIDDYELEYIRVWRTIKIWILSICVLVGFLFYISLPLVISFSRMN